MGFIGGEVGYRALKRICPDGDTGHLTGSAYDGRSKIEALFGPDVWRELEGRTVLDFGCGRGEAAVEIAQRGAARVIGLDIREHVLAEARERAAKAGVADRCIFTASAPERADVIMSMDAFEHFDDPAAILRVMRGLVRDDGRALIVFGPTWYHPLGGHIFSVFPWAHLLFTEKSLLRWRADFKRDGATRFSEIDGGLNQMTVRRFERLVAESDFRFESFEAVPIRKLRPIANRLTREFTTAVVRCRLVPRAAVGGEAAH